MLLTKQPKWLLATLLLFISSSCFAQESLPWEDPEVFQINRAPSHACFYRYSSAYEAQRGHRYQDSEWYQSLNGTWKFNWVKSPEDRPKDFFQNQFDTKSWDDIEVPSNWELKATASLFTPISDILFQRTRPLSSTVIIPLEAMCANFKFPIIGKVNPFSSTLLGSVRPTTFGSMESWLVIMKEARRLPSLRSAST